MHKANPSRFYQLVAVHGLLLATLSLLTDSSAWSKDDFSSQDIAPDTEGSFSQNWPRPAKSPPGAPNIVLILLDDVGFGAASVFGGVVQTPGLQHLAEEGLRYTRFHVVAQCSPTRASLLSGRNPHRLGFGVVGEGGFPGYNTVWPKEAVSVAEVLRRNGYSTAAIGKWHNTPMWEISPVGPFDRWPTSLGFESFYGFMASAENHWQPVGLYRNTTAVEAKASVKHEYHLTTDLADEAIDWIHTHATLAPQKPYFLYFATGATHRPNHVAKEWVERYKGKFDTGWDRLRKIIFARQKALGAIPSDARLTPRPTEIPAWSSLSTEQRRLLARQMEVYAAFLTQTDYEVDRVIRAAKEIPGGDNTLIMYIVGDNGASSEAGVVGDAESTAELLKHTDEMGGPDYPDPVNEYSSGWAWAMSTPFQWQKLIASHLGATRSPLVVSWPARIKDVGGWRSQYAHVNDVAATIYDIVRIELPKAIDGFEQIPLDGVSFAPSFTDSNARSYHTLQIYEQWGNRAIYKDGWQASARHFIPWDPERWVNREYDNDRWELYHLDRDFSQARDLSKRYPEKLKELRALFDSEAVQNNIYPLGGAKPLGDASVFQEARYPTAGRREFIYYSGLPRLPPWMAPDFNRSHVISAEIALTDDANDGVLVANGVSVAGFALYLKDRYLVYESTVGEDHGVLKSPEPLPSGKNFVRFEFIRDSGDASQDEAAGVGHLYVNNRLVSTAKMKVASSPVWGAFGVGRSFSQVSRSFSPPYIFTGELGSVRVRLQ